MATTAELNSELEALNKRLDALDAKQAAKDADLYKKKNAAESATTEKTYTLFASGLNHGGRDVELKNKNTSTDLAIIFDVVENHSFTQGVDKTQYATESKVKFSDHAVIEDGKFTFTARVNSSPMYLIQNNYIDKDTDKSNPMQSKRPQKALEALREMIATREVVTLVTEDIILENYICTNMTATRDGAEGDALSFDLEFTEFRTFTLGKTVLATNFSDAKKSGNKQKGAVNSSATDQQVDVMAKRSNLQTDYGKKVSTALGLDDYTSSMQKTGYYDRAKGDFFDNDGNPMKF